MDQFVLGYNECVDCGSDVLLRVYKRGKLVYYCSECDIRIKLSDNEIVQSPTFPISRWVTLMDSYHRDRALKYIDDDMFAVTLMGPLCVVLLHMFIWSDTNEGEEFWEEYYQTLRESV